MRLLRTIEQTKRKRPSVVLVVSPYGPLPKSPAAQHCVRLLGVVQTKILPTDSRYSRSERDVSRARHHSPRARVAGFCLRAGRRLGFGLGRGGLRLVEARHRSSISAMSWTMSGVWAMRALRVALESVIARRMSSLVPRARAISIASTVQSERDGRVGVDGVAWLREGRDGRNVVRCRGAIGRPSEGVGRWLRGLKAPNFFSRL